MTKSGTIGAALFAAALFTPVPIMAAQEAPLPPRLTWSFAGVLGTYDPGQLQRGFKIYKEVCANCHSIDLLAIGTLADRSGPGFSGAQVEALATQYKIADVNESGEPIERTGRSADHFPSPFPNELVARSANGGVTPPDMSTLAKARGYERGFPWFLINIVIPYEEQGPDYIVALLKGYADAPKDFNVPSGRFYNTYFPGHVIAMPPPFQAGQISFDDNAPQTIDQYSKDIAAFLMWTAESHLVDRKRVGFQVIIFLIALTGSLYFTKKNVWSSLDTSPPHTPSPR